MLQRLNNALFLVILAGLVLIHFACSDDNDSEPADPESRVVADAGYDADPEMPSVESIEFEGRTPSDRPRIHVESARKSGVIATDPPLEAQSFLSESQAAQLLGDTELETVSVIGQNSSPSQNSVRYTQAGSETTQFGVGLQIWAFDETDTDPDRRLAELRDQFLNVDDADSDDLSSGAFVSRRSGIRNLVFRAESDPYLFILSCGTDHCQGWEELTALGIEIADQH